MWGNSGDARGDAEANVVEASQLLHHAVYLQGVWTSRVQDGFGII